MTSPPFQNTTLPNLSPKILPVVLLTPSAVRSPHLKNLVNSGKVDFIQAIEEDKQMINKTVILNACVAISNMAQTFFRLHASNSNQQLSHFRSIPC